MVVCLGSRWGWWLRVLVCVGARPHPCCWLCVRSPGPLRREYAANKDAVIELAMQVVLSIDNPYAAPK